MTQPRLEILRGLPKSPAAHPPLVFVHGIGHAAWCWSHWLNAAAESGYAGYALSLRGHGGSEGRLHCATLNDYVSDVLRVADELREPGILVGHSMGALVVQLALSRRAWRAVALLAPISPYPALGSLALIARQHPLDLLRILMFRSLPMRPDYLFAGLNASTVDLYIDQMGPESPLVQFQLLLHLPPAMPDAQIPMLVLGASDDKLVSIGAVRRTAIRYGAKLQEFPRIGHDLMLDAGWHSPLEAMLKWLDEEF